MRCLPSHAVRQWDRQFFFEDESKTRERDYKDYGKDPWDHDWNFMHMVHEMAKNQVALGDSNACLTSCLCAQSTARA